MQQELIRPHGGELVDLLVDEQRAEELKQASRSWPSWDLSARQVCDLELLLVGGFSRNRFEGDHHVSEESRPRVRRRTTGRGFDQVVIPEGKNIGR